MKIQRTEKEKWTRPQLIVLGRSAPEEAVLAVCKTGQTSGPDLGNCDKTATCSRSANT